MRRHTEEDDKQTQRLPLISDPNPNPTPNPNPNPNSNPHLNPNPNTNPNPNLNPNVHPHRTMSGRKALLSWTKHSLRSGLRGWKFATKTLKWRAQKLRRFVVKWMSTRLRSGLSVWRRWAWALQTYRVTVSRLANTRCWQAWGRWRRVSRHQRHAKLTCLDAVGRWAGNSLGLAYTRWVIVAADSTHCRMTLQI